MTGLEALKEFKGNNNTILVGRVMGKQHYLDCLQAIEKSLKALEIINGKLVDVSLIKKYDFVEDYNSAVWIAGKPKLVKEEFNLLKECLE